MRYGIVIAIIIVVVLLALFFIYQDQRKKSVVLTVSHTPTPMASTVPTSAGGSASITPLTTPEVHVTVTTNHVIITATPGETKTPTVKTSPTP